MTGIAEVTTPSPPADDPGTHADPGAQEPTTPAPDAPVAPTQTAPAEPVPTVTVTQEPQSPEPAPTQTVVVEVPWTHEPAAASSTIPLGAIITALLVLVAATAALVLLVRRSRGPRPTGTIAAAALEPAASTTEIGVLDDAHAVAIRGEEPGDTPGGAVPHGPGRGDDRLERAGGAGDQDARTGRGDQRCRGRRGHRPAHSCCCVSVPGRTTTQTAASSAGWRQLRLHQVQDVLGVADDAESGRVGPVEGAQRIETAVAAPPLYSGRVRVLGYVGVSAGLAMILGGGLVDVLVAAVLGAAIACLQVATVRLPAAYQALVVLGCAFAVSGAVFLLSRTGIEVGMLAPLVAPLVTFLPGALLTTAAIDLATRQMIAGSARLAAGVMQLVLLALGIVGAAALVGVPASEVGSAAYQPLGWAGPWIGVLVYGTGVVFHNCARRPALPWILLVLVVAYAGQVVGGLFFGGVFSAFVGALLMTPVAMFAATRPTGPPALVGFLPGFWLLVPGALGLVGVTSVLGDGAQALSTVVTAGTTMVAISLGVLAGIALGSAVGRRAGLAVERF